MEKILIILEFIVKVSLIIIIFTVVIIPTIIHNIKKRKKSNKHTNSKIGMRYDSKEGKIKNTEDIPIH